MLEAQTQNQSAYEDSVPSEDDGINVAILKRCPRNITGSQSEMVELR